MAKASVSTAVSGEIVSSTELMVNESKFRKQSQSLYQQATKITVTDPESMKTAIEFGRGVSDLITQITEWFKPLKKKAKAVHTDLCEEEKKALAVPESAQAVVDGAIREYRQAEARLRQTRRGSDWRPKRSRSERRLQGYSRKKARRGWRRRYWPSLLRSPKSKSRRHRK